MFPVTHTDDRQINVLTKEFVLDKELLKHDYLKPENSDKKNQFFAEYNELIFLGIEWKFK